MSSSSEGARSPKSHSASLSPGSTDKDPTRPAPSSPAASSRSSDSRPSSPGSGGVKLDTLAVVSSLMSAIGKSNPQAPQEAAAGAPPPSRDGPPAPPTSRPRRAPPPHCRTALVPVSLSSALCTTAAVTPLFHKKYAG
eukprot:CAMPEP_0194266720 /NCGR_PEP_ID=MMETSP0169-20130528/1533_1 /TAXON_ID=218684 /ORGANISM="Corethron pennatum, Strain L29A3" /LENGTH=137 /DNA_ID=CAMNT_0039007473 /DNA_START=1124 /DNA_END=1537 /DNA_ORIENTATION=+